jgi:hypothetical protein
MRRWIIRTSRPLSSSFVSIKKVRTPSGFDRIPIGRRAEAFKMNDGGWSSQIKNLEAYVGQA